MDGGFLSGRTESDAAYGKMTAAQQANALGNRNGTRRREAQLNKNGREEEAAGAAASAIARCFQRFRFSAHDEQRAGGGGVTAGIAMTDQ